MNYYIKEKYRVFELVGDKISNYMDIKRIIESHGAKFILENNKILFQVPENISVYNIINDVLDTLTPIN